MPNDTIKKLVYHEGDASTLIKKYTKNGFPIMGARFTLDFF